MILISLFSISNTWNLFFAFSHTTHPILLLKQDSNCLVISETLHLERGKNASLPSDRPRCYHQAVCVCVCVCVLPKNLHNLFHLPCIIDHLMCQLTWGDSIITLTNLLLEMKVAISTNLSQDRKSRWESVWAEAFASAMAKIWMHYYFNHRRIIIAVAVFSLCNLKSMFQKNFLNQLHVNEKKFHSKYITHYSLYWSTVKSMPPFPFL